MFCKVCRGNSQVWYVFVTIRKNVPDNWTKMRYTKSILKDDCLPLYIIRKQSLFIFLFVVRLWHIQISGQSLNWELTKAFMTNISFFYKYQLFFSNVILLSNLTPSNISHSLFFISYSLTLILTALLKLTNKWHMPALLFNKLFSNPSNKTSDAFSKDAIT